MCLFFVFVCVCVFFLLLHGGKLLVVLLLLRHSSLSYLLLGTYHCVIVSRHVPCCDVAFGHFSSCFNSCLHKVKLLLNVSKYVSFLFQFN